MSGRNDKRLAQPWNQVYLGILAQTGEQSAGGCIIERKSKRDGVSRPGCDGGCQKRSGRCDKPMV